MIDMCVIFLAQKEGVLRIWGELTRCLSEESCKVSLYYYAEDKKEVLKRDALERLDDLHFEIIADVHAINLQGDPKDTRIVMGVSDPLQQEALLWFEELGVRDCVFL